MEPIRSGTTTERILRTAILTALFVGYSVWCFRDGYYTYPRHNAERLKENLTPVPEATPEFNRKVTKAKVVSLHDRVKQDKQQVTEEELLALLGEPTTREEQTWFFFGPGGMGRITLQDGLVRKAKWTAGQKKESDLFTQFLMGGVTGALGLVMILQFLRVLTTRIELTDVGLKVNSQGGRRWGGSPLVPFEAMTALNTKDYKKKGWVEVAYKQADGTEGTASLNDYVHRAFPEVVGEICRRQGFENPIKQPDQAADDEAGAAEVASGDTAGPAADDDGRAGAQTTDQGGG
jgi:hypothetical protein